MKWLVIAITLFTVGCGSTESLAVQEAPEGVEMLAEEDTSEFSEGDRPLGGLSGRWKDHLRDSASGWDFTMRSISRNVLRDWERLQRTFD